MRNKSTIYVVEVSTNPFDAGYFLLVTWSSIFFHSKAETALVLARLGCACSGTDRGALIEHNHATSPVLPGVLALAEKTGANGRTIATALVKGIKMEARLRVDGIAPSDVVALLDACAERRSSTQSNRLYSYLSGFFNWAADRHMIENVPIRRGMKTIKREVSRDGIDTLS